MKLKIDYQKREKLRSAAIIFPIDENNLDLMLFIYHVLNKRYKRNDYVCVYNNKKLPSNLFNSIFDVVITTGSNITECIKNIIITGPYSRLTFIGSNCIFYSKSQQLTLTYPEELSKKTCNTFDLFNPNTIYLTNSQRISANRAYQTCKHTFMYIYAGKPDTKSRATIKKRIETEKYANKLDTSIDNLIALKRKICLFNNMKQEHVSEHENIYKKLSKKYKKENIEIKSLDEIISRPSYTIGTYGYELSRKRDYKHTDKRINEQILSNKSKIEKREKLKKAKPPKVSNLVNTKQKHTTPNINKNKMKLYKFK